FSEIPVACHEGGIGVVVSEYAVVDPAYPDVVLIFLPGFYLFGTGNDGAKGFLAAVNDAGILAAGVLRIHILSVDSGSDYNLISGHCHLSGGVDVLEGHFLASVP